MENLFNNRVILSLCSRLIGRQLTTKQSYCVIRIDRRKSECELMKFYLYVAK